MNKLIAIFILFGLVSATSFAADEDKGVGEKSNVDCTKIFEGDAAKTQDDIEVPATDGDANGVTQ